MYLTDLLLYGGIILHGTRGGKEGNCISHQGRTRLW